MNETSSRSHAVFTIFLTSNRYEEVANLNTEKASRISLVDLAGSERANSTGATGVRLKEGANINKSLTTLGKVIAALAEQSHHPNKKSNANNFIPYRDSVLTWLLKDSLGGNSKTAMIAAISPADYDETMSTLRYADQAKRIKNKAIVNEDPNARLIRELKEELQALRDTLMIYAPEEVEKIQQKKSKGGHSRASSRATASPMLLLAPDSPIATKRGNSLLTKEQIIEQLHSSEKLLSEVNQTWEEKMSRTEAIHREREKALLELGVIVEKDNMGVYAPKSIHLINLNEDPLMTECLMYHIKPGITKVGRLGSTVPADIKLSGAEIANEHCYFENIAPPNNENCNIVTIHPNKDAVTLVNGMRISEPKTLHSGYRIIFGSGLHHLFRFNNPDEVRREREHLLQQGISPSVSATLYSATDSTIGISPTSTSFDQLADWDFAHAEALRKFGGPRAADLTVMTDEDLKQLSDGITKVREFRNRKRISSDSHQFLYEEPEGMNVSPRTSVSSSSNKRFSALSLAPTIVTEVDDHEEEKTSGLSKEEKDELIRLATEEIQQQLDNQKREYEEKIKQIESSNLRTDELNKERDELAAKYAQVKEEMERTLEQQKLAYENKIKRISAHLPPGTSLSSDDLLRAGSSAKQLMRMTIDKWRELRYVKMAEGCLVHAIVLKEANIMSKELGKNVVYQFVVVHDNISANPLSFWESTSALQPFMQEPDTHLMKEPKPCLAVQVIDHVHRATYIWSIAKLKHRLKRMRRLYDYSDGPLFTGQHFNREDPFYETPCPRFSLIGLARVPLRNLTLQLHADNYVDVYCRNTGKVMGQIRVLVTPIARSVSRKHHLQVEPKEDSDKLGLFYRRRKTSMQHQQEDQQALGEKYLLHIGQQQVFEIRIQELKGISETLFTQVHAQFRLSSFGNVEIYSSADKVYQTDPISNFGDTIVFGQCQTLSVNITESMMDVILNQGLTIEVYGQAQDNYLFELVEHAEDHRPTSSPPAIKSQLLEKMVNEKSSSARRVALERRFSVEQRTFDGILMEERHDILAWVQICELNADGQYVPVQVIHSETNDPHHPHLKQHQDTFYLRQGLQRRISLTLTHDSGKQFEWGDVKHVKLGQARLMDNKGKVIETSENKPVDIHLFPDPNATTYSRNGIARINVQGPWDSSLHDCLFLNRVTSAGQHVRLNLSWQVTCDKCVAPITFDMDVSVRIQGRSTTITSSSSSSSMFRQFLLGGSDSNGSIEKTVYKASSMFVVHLKPPMTRQVKELWRLNTANKYVRGEEFIGSWKPRGVSLITDYREARKRMLYRESVAAFRHSLVLLGHPQTKVIQRHQSDHLIPSDASNFYINYMTNQQIEEEEDAEPVDKKHYDPEALAKKVIDLWQTKFGVQEEVYVHIFDFVNVTNKSYIRFI